uniref:Uncharacterized protein n=1 Tax=Arundo donax TaxID=35708 RepID=A0A0A9GAI9_ARUDO
MAAKPQGTLVLLPWTEPLCRTSCEPACNQNR